jgi:hypothetical protein
MPRSTTGTAFKVPANDHIQFGEPRSGLAYKPLASPNSETHHPGMADEITDLRAQLAEAKTDKKLSDVLGEMRASRADANARFDVAMAKIDAKFDVASHQLNTMQKGIDEAKSLTRSWGQWVIATVIAIGFGIIAAFIGMMAFGQAGFGLGLSTHDTIKAAVSEYVAQHPASPSKP